MHGMELKKNPIVLLRESVGVSTSPLGMEALCSASCSHKAELGNEHTLHISLQLLSGSLHLAQTLGASEKPWHSARK